MHCVYNKPTLRTYSAQLGRGHHSDDSAAQPSKLGNMLAQKMSQRVVLLVLVVLFVTPFMSTERDATFPMQMTLTAMEYLHDGRSLDEFVNDVYIPKNGDFRTGFRKLLLLRVKGKYVIRRSSRADHSFFL